MAMLRKGVAICGPILSNVSQTLKEAKADMQDYKLQLERLEGRSRFECTRYERLKVYTSGLASLLSLVRRLPVELLMRIFALACAENDLRYHSCGTALVIASVCSRWRGVALNCPELWSQLTLDLTAEYQYDERYDSVMTEVAILYLKQSSHHPLSLMFEGSPWTYSMEGCGNHPVLKKLCDESMQWKHVSFSMPEFRVEEFPAWMDLQLPMLESLTMRLDKEEDSMTLGFMVQNAPNLRLIWTSNVYLVWDDMLAVDLHELQYDLNVRNFYDVVSQFSNLRRLHVGNLLPPSVWNSLKVSIPVELLNVEELLVDFKVSDITASNNYLCCLLSLLTLPKLQVLLLKEGSEQDERAAFGEMANFLIQSQCSLEVLTIGNIKMLDEETVVILRLAPNLRELTVEDHRHRGNIITVAFLHSLHASRRSSIQTSGSFLVQGLNRLKLVLKRPNADLSAFVDAVVSQSGLYGEAQASSGVTMLTSVELWLSNQEGPVVGNILEPLRQLESISMRIVVKRRGENEYLV
ncbi:hypothetical protein GYMLUDRAFT_265623 [Collybiopsis luxurians FD-317 M1]|uniref:F-box domain-containing protein n=1 Tax=Collybiopsis luxurians FD-317 M1 TaxID=944289 RepID=A0A0D0AP09_9AGAR|nr:hypothetical protein GYMLUDRAFT_265623 [Collybiopsis luxurians FD-317 M1]